MVALVVTFFRSRGNRPRKSGEADIADPIARKLAQAYPGDAAAQRMLSAVRQALGEPATLP